MCVMYGPGSQYGQSTQERLLRKNRIVVWTMLQWVIDFWFLFVKCKNRLCGICRLARASFYFVQSQGWTQNMCIECYLHLCGKIIAHSFFGALKPNTYVEHIWFSDHKCLAVHYFMPPMNRIKCGLCVWCKCTYTKRGEKKERTRWKRNHNCMFCPWRNCLDIEL